MDVKIEESWKQHLAAEFEKPYFANLVQMVKREYAQFACYPPGRLIFNAFNLCPFDKVKVVIIGQDPYHEPGQAMGLSFSVPEGIPMPPSLINIFKEIELDLHQPMPASGNLTRWVLWGGYARSKAALINRSKHLVLQSVHPSPLSANRGGWFGNHHFSQANAFLAAHQLSPIHW